MRITHVVGTDGFAGLERYVADVAGEQARRGHDVVVLGARPAAMQSALAGTGARWSAGATPREMAAGLLRGGGRDLLHSHITPADTVAALTAPATRGARVSTRHIPHPRGFGRLGKALAPWVRRQLALEIAVSAWTSAQFDSPSDAVLLNGVPEQPDSHKRRERVVLMAQRLDPEKDTLTGLRAWAACGLAEKGWRLQVAGAGSEEVVCRAEAERLGITGSTDFLGWVSDITAAYQRAAVMLAPAPTEPCGLSILQAMALGTPVVAASSGGNAETIGSLPAARTFPAGGVAAAAAHLAALEGEREREEYGQRLLELQRRSFSIAVHVDGLMGLYERARSRQR